MCVCVCVCDPWFTGQGDVTATIAAVMLEFFQVWCCAHWDGGLVVDTVGLGRVRTLFPLVVTAVVRVAALVCSCMSLPLAGVVPLVQVPTEKVRISSR